MGFLFNNTLLLRLGESKIYYMKLTNSSLFKTGILGLLWFFCSSFKIEGEVLVRPIQNFTVKENLINANGLSIVATDSLGKPDEKISPNLPCTAHPFDPRSTRRRSDARGEARRQEHGEGRRLTRG